MLKTPEFYTSLVKELPYFRRTKWVLMLQTMAADWMWDQIETNLLKDPWSAFTGEDLRQPLTWDRSRYDNRLNQHFDGIQKAVGLEKLKDVVKWLNKAGLSIETGVRVVGLQGFAAADQKKEFFWNRPKQNSWVLLSSTRRLQISLPLLDFRANPDDLGAVEQHRPHDAVKASLSAISYQLRLVWDHAVESDTRLQELDDDERQTEVQGFLTALLQELFGIQEAEVRYVRGRYVWLLDAEVEMTYSVPNKIVYTQQWQQHYLTPVGTEEQDQVNQVGTVALGPRALRHISNEVLARFVAQLWQLQADLNAEFKPRALNALARSHAAIQSLMSRPEVREFLRAQDGRDFTIQEVIDYSVTLPVPETATKCSELRLGHDIRISYDEWTWPYQRAVVSKKSEEPKIKNYVLRLDWVSAGKYLTAEKITSIQQDLAPRVYHPNSQQPGVLTLGWVRYTVWAEKDAVVCDEIQTDLGPTLRDLGFGGWAEKVLWYFLAFSFQHLRHTKVLVPDFKTKINVYRSRLPDAIGVQIYEKLPQRMGAEQKLTLKVRGESADFWVITNPGLSTRATTPGK